MSTAAFNPETASFEELQEAANREAGELAAKEQKERDEQGRFVKKEDDPQETPPAAATEPPAAPAEKVVYQHVVDLGDGSGSQVFTGDSLEELIEKMGEAQKHATKKIKELTLEKRAEAVTKAAPSDDQEWLVSQEFLAKPTQTIRKLAREMFEEAQREAQAQAKSDTERAQAFLASHPEFVKNDKNAQRMEKALRLEGLENTLENLNKVYMDLSESGLLELKSEEQIAETTDTTQTSRIASSGAKVITVTRKAASGISSKRSAPPVIKQGPTEKELYDMPLEELERLALQADRQQK